MYRSTEVGSQAQAAEREKKKLMRSTAADGEDENDIRETSEEVKNYLRAMIPDSAVVELDPGEPIS